MIIHPIYKITISIVLVVITLSCMYYLFKLMPTGDEVKDYVNLHKALLYGSAIIASVIGLFILNAKMK